MMRGNLLQIQPSELKFTFLVCLHSAAVMWCVKLTGNIRERRLLNVFFSVLGALVTFFSRNAMLSFFFIYKLQPVKETREKQVELWKELILEYCRSQKVFTIGLEDFPLFINPEIERSLNHESRVVFLSALVSEGRAEWIDKGHRRCRILWRSIPEWANYILNFVKENGFESDVMTIEDIRSGTETRGTDLEGIDRDVLMRALKVLEQKGKAAIIESSSVDTGVKFAA